MSNSPPLRFSHNRHLLAVKGCEAEPDVLAFEGDEALSTPFRYRIEFSSSDHAISKEMMLMKAGSLTLDALKDIRISSSEGKLIISAKQEIVLTSGGGYIRIADGTVECAAPDKIIERGAVWQKFGGQSISQAMQSWENAEFAITPEVRRLSDDSPVAGLTLGLTGGDGTQQSLATSASGATAMQNNINIDSLNASLLDKT